jgi:hypothetical protein
MRLEAWVAKKIVLVELGIRDVMTLEHRHFVWDK